MALTSEVRFSPERLQRSYLDQLVQKQMESNETNSTFCSDPFGEAECEGEWHAAKCFAQGRLTFPQIIKNHSKIWSTAPFLPMYLWLLIHHMGKYIQDRKVSPLPGNNRTIKPGKTGLATRNFCSFTPHLLAEGLKALFQRRWTHLWCYTDLVKCVQPVRLSAIIISSSSQ